MRAEATPTGSARAPRRVRSYLTGALDLIQRTALFSDSLDWDAVRQDAEVVLGQACCYADTHALLAAVLRLAGGRHSRLSPPRLRQEMLDHAARVLDPAVPTGRIIEAVGYLKLPWLPAGRRPARRYLVTAGDLLDAMIAARPGGWIVDLRGNVGGNMWPMLAATAPLLHDGVLGYFILPGDRSQAWSLDRGRARLDGRQLARSRGHLRRAGHAPVAVLTSDRTASAGEAVAIAFRGDARVRTIGTPTAGFTTGNHIHILRDGTRLSITGSCYADRDWHRYTSPVPVDHQVDGDDPAAPLSAALSWIHQQNYRTDDGPP